MYTRELFLTQLEAVGVQGPCWLFIYVFLKLHLHETFIVFSSREREKIKGVKLICSIYTNTSPDCQLNLLTSETNKLWFDIVQLELLNEESDSITTKKTDQRC